MITKSDKRRPGPDLFLFALAGKFWGYFPGYSKEISKEHCYITWAILKAHTKNTAGYVRLRSANPQDVPEINFRYFDEGNDHAGHDLEAVINGVELARAMTKKAGHLIEAEEVPGPHLKTREETS